LQRLGERFTGVSTPGSQDFNTLDFAVRYDSMWEAVFSKISGGRRGGFWFYWGAKAFYPDGDAHTIELLKQERDRVFNNIKRLYESFANAFIQNYNPSEALRIKQYFRDRFIYPYNDSPSWQVATPEDKFAFCKLSPRL
jgi:hypothetical protein